MEGSQWYSVRRVFRHGSSDRIPGGWIYEERVVLIEAVDFDEAIERSGTEAREYEMAVGSCQDLGFAQVYELTDEVSGNGAEVFSLMRDSELDAEAFIDHYFVDGTERSGTIEGNGKD